MTTVDVYPVGMLSSLQRAYNTAFHGRLWANAFWVLRLAFRRLWRNIRAGNWREVKNTFNGYLAEPTPFPEHMTRCGSGWTKKRALRSLRRHGYPQA